MLSSYLYFISGDSWTTHTWLSSWKTRSKQLFLHFVLQLNFIFPSIPSKAWKSYIFLLILGFPWNLLPEILLWMKFNLVGYQKGEFSFLLNNSVSLFDFSRKSIFGQKLKIGSYTWIMPLYIQTQAHTQTHIVKSAMVGKKSGNHSIYLFLWKW
jgi:hypothetical protein